MRDCAVELVGASTLGCSLETVVVATCLFQDWLTCSQTTQLTAMLEAVQG